MKLEVDLDALVVDGRDFLYTLAHALDRPVVIEAIRSIYGLACLNLMAQAQGRDVNEAFARVDLACQDGEVVRHHLANQHVIAGRYGTLFRSSVMLRPSEAAPRMLRIWTPTRPQPRPPANYVLEDLMQGVFGR
jgi:hypothetical protein